MRSYDLSSNYSDAATVSVTTLPIEGAEWRFRARCEGQESYPIEARFDVSDSGAGSLGEQLEDYDGEQIDFRYELRCTSADGDGCSNWRSAGETVSGTLVINEGREDVRVDTFALELSTREGVDVPTTPVTTNEGCNAFVHFDRPGQTPAADRTPRIFAVGPEAQPRPRSGAAVFVP